MSEGMVITLAAFLAASGLVAVLGLLVSGRAATAEERLDGLQGTNRSRSADHEEFFPEAEQNNLHKIFVPRKQDERKQLGDRLVQAGLYKRNSLPFYVAMKSGLMLIPICVGIAASQTGVMSSRDGLMYGGISGLLGTVVPSFWLDRQKKKRQTSLRRALPDALDIIVICVEAGLSLPASFLRVSKELRTAHPLLAAELTIVQREIQMGRSTGEALKHFAERFDLEELRGLASVVLQAERFGASVVKALRVHADTLRLKRMQYAEEQAQKAAVKILFPTVLFIFPAMFVVLLGPAVFQIMEGFSQMGK